MIALRDDGLYWPEQVGGMRAKFHAWAGNAIPAVLEHCKGRDVAVQAGGHVGVFPLALSRHFAAVYTFEPEPTNWECLVKNTDPVPGIYRFNLGLSSSLSEALFRYCAGNSGKHHVTNVAKPGENLFQARMVALDDLNLSQCDLIYLDIEGWELHALQGAEETIETCRPVIVVEDNKLCRQHGIPDHAVARWLRQHGYVKRQRVDEDEIWVPL